MKKLLTALILSAVVLSGCGVFRSHHAWKQAKQENPLQVPPNMDRPSTAAALTIPPASEAANQSSATAPAKPGAASAVDATSMQLPQSVDKAYQRVGLALQQGDSTTVTRQDAAQHTYRVAVRNKPQLQTSKGFLQKHFSNLNQQGNQESVDQASQASSGGPTVTITVSASDGGSTVRAQGDPKAAARVISALKGRLGG